MIDPPAAFRNVYRAYAGLDRPGLRLAELRWPGSFSRSSARSSWPPPVRRLAAAAGRAGAARRSPRDRRARPPRPPCGSGLPPRSRRRSRSCRRSCASSRRFVVAAARGSIRGRPARRGARAARSPPVPDAVLWMAALFAARLLLAAGYVGPYDAFFLPLPIVVAAAGLFGARGSRWRPPSGAALPAPRRGGARRSSSRFASLAMRDLYRGQPRGAASRRRPAALVLPEPVAGATAGALDGARPPAAPAPTLVGLSRDGVLQLRPRPAQPLLARAVLSRATSTRAGEARAVARPRRHPPDALAACQRARRRRGRPRLRPGLPAADSTRPLRSRYRRRGRFGPGARPGARIGDPQFFVEIARRSRRRRGQP